MSSSIHLYIFLLYYYSFIHLFIYSFIHLLIYSFIHFFIYPFILLFIILHWRNAAFNFVVIIIRIHVLTCYLPTSTIFWPSVFFYVGLQSTTLAQYETKQILACTNKLFAIITW